LGWRQAAGGRRHAPRPARGRVRHTVTGQDRGVLSSSWLRARIDAARGEPSLGAMILGSVCLGRNLARTHRVELIGSCGRERTDPLTLKRQRARQRDHPARRRVESNRAMCPRPYLRER